MKRYLAFLLGAFVLLVVSCSKDEAKEQNNWFQPPVPAVEGTTVTFSCSTSFAEGVLTPQNAGVSYAQMSNGTLGAFTEAQNVTVSGNTISCRLTGLSPKSTYLAYAYAQMGSERVQSDMSMFTTGEGGETPPPAKGEPTFSAPTYSGVTTSSATVSCTYSYEGEKPVSKVYFVYATSTGSNMQAEVTTSTGLKTASLTGLAALTTYSVNLCVEVGGTAYSSSKISFTTNSSGGGTGGNTKFKGWAELPEETTNSNLYYAYHMRPDASSMRNSSICYSKEMNCAVWVAYPLHQCYMGKAGRNESWKYDPIIPQSVQPDLDSSYKSSGQSYSRGHMMASSDRQISAATNRQTFFFTNMAPQIQNEFNGGIWEKLENWCRGTDVMCSDTLYVVTGAYFANKNKTCRDNSSKTVVVPTHFYKVLIRSKSGNTGKPLWELPADQIKCVAWWFEHNNSYSTTARPTAAYMKSVSFVEQQTGLKFFTNVPNAPKDTFEAADWKM